MAEETVGGHWITVGQALRVIHDHVGLFKDVPRLGEPAAEGEVAVPIDQSLEDKAINVAAGRIRPFTCSSKVGTQK